MSAAEISFDPSQPPASNRAACIASLHERATLVYLGAIEASDEAKRAGDLDLAAEHLAAALEARRLLSALRPACIDADVHESAICFALAGAGLGPGDFALRVALATGSRKRPRFGNPHRWAVTARWFARGYLDQSGCLTRAGCRRIARVLGGGAPAEA